MKALKQAIVLISMVIMTSCAKPVNCNGTVYSQNNIPVAGVKVILNVYTTASSYPTYYKECVTDANGNYYFSETVRKKAYLAIECRCDSGYAQDAWGKWSDLDGRRVDLYLKR